MPPCLADSATDVGATVTTGELPDDVPLKPFEADEDDAAGGAISDDV